MVQRSLFLIAGMILVSTGVLSAQQTGFLKVASYPAGAEITVDGLAVGKATSSLETAEILTLEVGPHNLYIFIEGVADRLEIIDIAAGDTTEIFIPLREPEGFLTVITEPSDAQVSVGDSAIGFTPLRRIPFPVQQLSVSIYKDCFLPENELVDLTIGLESELNLTLRQQVRLSASSAVEIQRVEICQTGSIVRASYVLAGRPDDRFDVYPVLRRETGELLSMPIEGSVGQNLAPGAGKSIIISLAPNIPEFETIELTFNVVPSKKGGGKTVLFVLGAAVVAGGAAAAVLLGGGDTADPTPTAPTVVRIALPPGPPGG